MKILKANVKNFGSYRNLQFCFDNIGLSLVYGATGSGKSTLQDIVPWVLYGVTSKNGAVNEIRHWHSNGEPTVGSLELDIKGRIVTVVRIRGSSQENDLYWFYDHDPYRNNRGKDLLDTQKNLVELLGIGSAAYLMSTTYTEFSESGNFFLSKSKDRREVFEMIADLHLPRKITECAAKEKKKVKSNIESMTLELNRILTKLGSFYLLEQENTAELNAWNEAKKLSIDVLTKKEKHFASDMKKYIKNLEDDSYKFEADLATKIHNLIDKLDDLDQKIKPKSFYKDEENRLKSLFTKECPTCGHRKESSDALDALKEDKALNLRYTERFADCSRQLEELQKVKNPNTGYLELAKKSENHYSEQIRERQEEINPFVSILKSTEMDISSYNCSKTNSEGQLFVMKQRLGALEQLSDISLELAGYLVKNVINTIQNDTNASLQKYFDSEFKVEFTLAGSDDLDVNISKNGNPCVYKQLSKGQRSLLRLCFVTSVMKAASNKFGVSSNLLTFDEALDGMDVDLKIKAFSLFQDLNKHHESIMVSEHTPEFQNLFSEKYKVTLKGDQSVIEHE